jgi:hypothetical protein
MSKTLVWVLGILCVATTATIAGADPGYWIWHSPNPGDANNDGTVDVVDLGVLAKNYDRHVYVEFDWGPILLGAAEPQASSYDDIIVRVTLPFDVTGDGNVDVVDLGIFAKSYPLVPGERPVYIGVAGNPSGDFNFDHVVDVLDLGILAKNYDWSGAPAGGSVVPEPMTLSLLAVGAAALLRRKR